MPEPGVNEHEWEEEQWSLSLRKDSGCLYNCRQAARHGQRQGGWGKAAARQKVAMGEVLHSLPVRIKAVSPEGRFVTPCFLVQLPEFSLSVL